MADVIYNDRYRLDAKIGEGGMAVVYRGYDLILRRQVAVKVLRPKFSADAAFVDRFDFEAQAAAKLSHPNIVTTHDVGKVDGDHYIVEEYVPGETLGTLIARQGRLPESVAVRYARQICAALAAAHRQELLHRDIKPSNILITREDVVRVTDFGIAHAVGEDADVVLGSLPYCPPEALLGEPVSEASDLYSLGAVLYEMVTGVRPFKAVDSEALRDRARSGARSCRAWRGDQRALRGHHQQAAAQVAGRALSFGRRAARRAAPTRARTRRRR